MNSGRQFAAFVVVLALAMGAGCDKKKPQLPMQAHAPTLPVDLPDQIPEAAPPPEPPPPAQEATAAEPPKTKPQGRKHTSSRKTSPPPANAQNAAPSNTVAANHTPANPVAETPSDTAIAADISSQQATRQKQTTVQLIGETEKNLKGLKSGLTHDEESMVTQIKSYVSQSRRAISDNDLERAYNLAKKALLLSDALVKK